MAFSRSLVFWLLYASVGFSQAAPSAKCAHPVTAAVAAPIVQKDYVSRSVVTGLSYPRGIVFDKNGHLLVVQSGEGVQALTMGDDGGSCVWMKSKKTVLDDSSVCIIAKDWASY